MHDTILFYAQDGATWNPQYLPHDPAYIQRTYRNTDERGRWRSADLTASGLRSGYSGEPWRGIDPGAVGNHWRTPTKGGMSAFIVERGLILGWPDAYPTVQERLDALDKADLIHWPKRGTMPSLKRYLGSTKGNAFEDVITDVGKIEATAKEKVGYPTQKPLVLLDRIVKASSNAGDTVLDPFCGCATALVAADRLNRQWVGIDLSPLAAKLVLKRIKDDRGELFDGVTDRTDIPSRTDHGPLPSYRTHRHTLYGRQEGTCAGCCVMFPFRNMTVDHVVPQSKGGSDHLDNLQLLCGACNSSKGVGSQEALIAKLIADGLRQ